MTAAPSTAFPRRYVPWLALLLAAHVGLLVYAAHEPITAPLYGFRLDEYAWVALVTLAVAGAAFALAARHAYALACAGALLVAVALLRPGPVAVALLGLLNAYVIGGRVLRHVARDEHERLPFSVAILTGVCLWSAVLAMTGPLKVHYPPVYAVALLAPLAFLWRDTRAALLASARVFAPSERTLSGTERGWLALLATTIVLHLFLVARPDVGYDATTMHLQVPLLVESAHRFAFDVTRYAWAVMPLGADWMYTASYLLGGEAAARCTNLAFGALGCHVLYVLVRRHARPELALASVTLVASTPMAMLETGSLYIESLWSAYLLATLLLALEIARHGAARAWLWAPLALMAAGALQTKTIAVLWLVPLVGYLLVHAPSRRALFRLDRRAFTWVVIGIAIGAWPYANAWWRTGNPVFPFMNAWFGSPYFDTVTSFTNPLYVKPLRPWSLYESIVAAGRFGEGRNGAIGFHWLLLLPLVLLAVFRPAARELRLCAALAAIFFAAVFVQQAYLRYLWPAFLVLAVIGGWAAAGLPDRRGARGALLAVGTALCALHVRVAPTGAWDNATLCPRCSYEASVRGEFIGTYMPSRSVSEFLTRQLPGARVAFLVLNGPSPAGFVGYSRSANWHDAPMFAAVANAVSADEVAAAVARFKLDYAVFNTDPAHENPGIREFRLRHTTPVWQFQNFIVARIDAAAR